MDKRDFFVKRGESLYFCPLISRNFLLLIANNTLYFSEVVLAQEVSLFTYLSERKIDCIPFVVSLLSLNHLQAKDFLSYLFWKIYK